MWCYLSSARQNPSVACTASLLWINAMWLWLPRVPIIFFASEHPFSLEDMSHPLGDIFPQIVGSTWDLFMFTCGNTLCTWKKKQHEKHHSSQESYFLHMDLFHHHLGSTCGRWHTFLTWGNTFYSVLDRFSSHTDMFTSFVNKCFNKECNFLHFGTCFVQFRIYFFSLGKILLGARECTFFTCGYIWFT